MGAERQLLRSLRTMAPVAPGARVALQSSARLRRTPVKSSDQISLLNVTVCVDYRNPPLRSVYRGINFSKWLQFYIQTISDLDWII